MTTGREDHEPIRWGILGAGGIADTVATDIALTSGNVVHAVAARDGDRAADFAARHGAARSSGDYDELLGDPDVDVVYVATTHPSHHGLALAAIAAGKAVLVEKPLCLNAFQAREVFDAALSRGVFSMEAMWMRTNPLVLQALQLVRDGAIGEVRGLRSEFGLGYPFDPGHRLYDADNGGGALLDIGIYPVAFAHAFLGRPDEVRTVGTLAATGIDDTVSMQWMYDGEPRAQLWCSLSVDSPNEAAVLGTDGWISFGSPAFRPTSLTLHSRSADLHVADPLVGQGTGYGPEVEEVARCLRAGLLESPLVPHAATLEVLAILDTARAELGVRYVGE